MRVRISWVMLQCKGNKDICLSTQVLDCMRDTWTKNETISLFVRNNDFFNFLLVAKAYQRRPQYGNCFKAFCVIVIAPHNTGKTDNDCAFR